LSEHPPVEPTDEITRRRWLLRLGEMVFLAGVSGLVPEALWSQLENGEDVGLGSLPPGLYAPSADHLVHVLQHSGKLLPLPVGSEVEFALPSSLPYHPLFFSADEYRMVSRFVEIVLGKLEPSALSQVTLWLDLWHHSAGGVLEAARNLDPSHRVLAAAYFGEPSVRETETSNPQLIARAGLAALNDLSKAHHGKTFLELTATEQANLITFVIADRSESPLRRFFEVMRAEAIRGFYTSAEGLKDLDYKGNAYYPQCPGCLSDHRAE
jgi:Gluconate 2-dehydrogenase subunit 3